MSTLPKSNRTSSAQVPVTNINTYIRVPGQPPYPLGRALQEWDGVEVLDRVEQPTGEGPVNAYVVREVIFTTSEGQFRVVVNEQIFETALYTRATKRFTDWLKVQNKGSDVA